MKLKILPLYKDTKIPEKTNFTDSGYDVFFHSCETLYDPMNCSYNNVDSSCLVLEPFHRALVKVGFKGTYGPGYEIQVRPRSGIPLKQGVLVANSPGTVDESYRGEFGVILFNLSKVTVSFKRGDKIAQIVPVRVELPEIEIVNDLDETSRGEGGFGSTGN